ncbi:MAG: YceI family protein, partial [Chloroflexota bacterium]
MSRRVQYSIGAGIVLLLLASLFLYESWFGFGGIQSGDATAPTLEADVSEQIVYRIDTTQSSVQYEVNEIFAGRDVSTAIGTTTQLAGDILLDTDDYANSQVGTIVINVEQFTSNSDLRDRRIRQEFLESESYPEATFAPTELVNFPEAINEGESYSFQMLGELTIRETTQSEQWDVTATLSDDRLTGTATITILMSDYDVGPIEIIGLVETSDEVLLTFDFVAIRVSNRI